MKTKLFGFVAGVCAAVALVAIMAMPAHALPTRIVGHVLYFSSPGDLSNGVAPDFIGGGKHAHDVVGTRLGVPTTMQVDTLYANDNSIQINLVVGNPSNADHRVTVYLAAPDGALLQRGRYLDAQREPFKDAGHPGLWVAVDSRGCNTDYGDFFVHYIRRVADGHITRLSVSWHQHCNLPDTPVLRGSLRYAELG